MIDWVHAMLVVWGRARRRIEFGPYPQPKSLAYRIWREGPSGASAHSAPAPLEGMTGVALQVSVATHLLLDLATPPGARLTDREYEMIYAKYVVPAKYDDGNGRHSLSFAEKARILGVSRQRAYKLVDSAQRKLAGMLDDRPGVKGGMW